MVSADLTRTGQGFPSQVCLPGFGSPEKDSLDQFGAHTSCQGRGGELISCHRMSHKKGGWETRVEIISIFVLPDDDDEGINEEGHN